MIERYLVFAGYNPYPLGGWDDYMMHFSTKEEASKFAIGLCKPDGNYEWSQVVDLHDATVITHYSDPILNRADNYEEFFGFHGV